MKKKFIIFIIIIIIIIFTGCHKSEKHLIYSINGTKYITDNKGTASWYGKKFHGRKTANGEIYNMHNLTAAHKELPFGTFVKVTNIKNNKNVIIRINDRGPYKKNRILDLSYAAAKKLDMINDGIADVKLEIVKRGEK